MTAVAIEHVTRVQHWNPELFSFRTTRSAGFRFENGHFVMLGLEVDGRPLLRAYSIASPNWIDHLEFFSIKVPNGPLTSRLQHLAVGDQLFVSRKPTGTLLLQDLRPGQHLYLLCTGTGLAPFLSVIQDPDAYRRFEKVVLVHGVRSRSDLAYARFICDELPNHEWLGEQTRAKLIYYPMVTREPFRNRGRLTDHILNGKLAAAIGLTELCPQHDRFMVCGSPSMLRDTCVQLDALGFEISARTGELGDYVIERAFVER